MKGVCWVIRKMASTSGWTSAKDWRTPNVVVSRTVVLFPSVASQLSLLRMSLSGSPRGQEVLVGDPRIGYGLKVIEEELAWNSGSATSTESRIKFHFYRNKKKMMFLTAFVWIIPGNAHSFIKVRGSITVPSTSRKTSLDMAVVDINNNVLYYPVRPAFWEVDSTWSFPSLIIRTVHKFQSIQFHCFPINYCFVKCLH